MLWGLVEAWFHLSGHIASYVWATADRHGIRVEFFYPQKVGCLMLYYPYNWPKFPWYNFQQYLFLWYFPRICVSWMTGSCYLVFMKVGWHFCDLWKESGVCLGTELSWKDFGWSPCSAHMTVRLFPVDPEHCLMITNTHYHWHWCSSLCWAGCGINNLSCPPEWDTTFIIFCKSVITTFTNVYTDQVLFSWFIIINLEICLSEWSCISVSL
jgi:hypothetical protein